MQLDCCGTQEYLDWKNASFSANSDVPDSCCLSTIEGCGKGVLTLTLEEAKMKIHTDGCFLGFSDMIQENVGFVGGIGIGIGFLQVDFPVTLNIVHQQPIFMKFIYSIAILGAVYRMTSTLVDITTSNDS